MGIRAMVSSLRWFPATPPNFYAQRLRELPFGSYASRAASSPAPFGQRQKRDPKSHSRAGTHLAATLPKIALPSILTALMDCPVGG